MPAAVRLLLLLGVVLLVACAVTPVPDPTATVMPTPEPARAGLPTETPMPTPLIATVLPTPRPMLTVQPAPGLPLLARGMSIRRPYMVMIDNFAAAYPQSGLDHAAIVFEALAEGGITRFMALFVPDSSTNVAIGPVRSTRLYFAQWAMGFHA